MAGDLTATGLDDVARYFQRMPDTTQTAVDNALTEHGKVVRTEAARLAPSASGALRSAITTTFYGGAGGLSVKVDTTKAPHGYTYHATAMGKSRGYMVFKIPTHTRRGVPVAAHKRLRAIPNNPFLFVAFQRKIAALSQAIDAALTKAVNG